MPKRKSKGASTTRPRGYDAQLELLTYLPLEPHAACVSDVASDMGLTAREVTALAHSIDSRYRVRVRNLGSGLGRGVSIANPAGWMWAKANAGAYWEMVYG